LRRFSLSLIFIVSFTLLAACSKEPPSPDPEESPPPVSGEEPTLPIDPSPPFVTDSEPSGSPVPPPEYPSVELAVEWRDNAITAESITYKNTFKKGGTTTLSANGSFPQTGVAAIDTYFASCRDDFTRKCEFMAEEAAFDTRAYEFDANYTVECNAGGLFSVSRTRHEYMGGARGETYIFCETFSAADGRLLTIDDFFNAEREVYTPRLLEFVVAFIDENPGDYWTDAKDNARNFFPYDTFCITKDGVSLFFPENNIGPHTLGVVRVDVPWGAIAEMFTLP